MATSGPWLFTGDTGVCKINGVVIVVNHCCSIGFSTTMNNNNTVFFANTGNYVFACCCLLVIVVFSPAMLFVSWRLSLSLFHRCVVSCALLNSRTNNCDIVIVVVGFVVAVVVTVVVIVVAFISINFCSLLNNSCLIEVFRLIVPTYRRLVLIIVVLLLDHDCGGVGLLAG